MNETIELEYRQEMYGLRFTAQQKAAIAARAAETVAAGTYEEQAPRARSFRRAALAAVSCVLAVALSVTALAAGFPGFREWLFGPESGVADRLTAISETAEAQGIEMEVVAAVNDGGTMQVYFTLRDAEGRGRLDQNAHLHVLSRAGEAGKKTYDVGGSDFFTGLTVSYRAVPVGYDPETETLMARFEVPNMEQLTTDTMDISLTAFESGTELGAGRVPFSAELLGGGETRPIDAIAMYEMTPSLADGSYSINMEWRKNIPFQATEGDPLVPWISRQEAELWQDESGTPAILKGGEVHPIEGTELVTLNGMAFVNGRLRVQLGLSPEFSGKYFSGFGRVWLARKDIEIDWERFFTDAEYASDMGLWAYRSGQAVFPCCEGNFSESGEGVTLGAALEGERISYISQATGCELTELIFDISEEELEDYALVLETESRSCCLRDEWTVSFPIPEADTEVRTEELTLADGSAVTAEIGTASITFRGEKAALAKLMDEAPRHITAEFEGRTISYTCTTMAENTLAGGLTLEVGSDKAVYAPDLPVEPGKVTAITIGENKFSLN